MNFTINTSTTVIQQGPNRANNLKLSRTPLRHLITWFLLFLPPDEDHDGGDDGYEEDERSEGAECDDSANV